MTTLREAAQQALEALLKSHTCPLLPDDCEEAITALRAALAQQAEPVEPVARVVEHGATVRLEWVSADAAHNAKVGPLFSMLPQRKPLTEEQIKACEKQAMADGALPHEQRLLFAREIERAHGIGEQDSGITSC